MVGKKRGVIAVAVALIVLVTCASLIILNSHDRSLADKMLIDRGDLGLGWLELGRFARTAYEPVYNSSSAEYVSLNMGYTYIRAHLIIFNSSSEASRFYDSSEYSGNIPSVPDDRNYVAIGDGGYITKPFGANAYIGIIVGGSHYTIDPSRYMRMIFVKDFVVVYIDVFDRYQMDETSIIDLLLNIGQIQLEKIEANLH